MNTQIIKRLPLYQVTVIFSVLFALIGFSYNVWRMEVSEENSNIRTACFEMLINLSSLEQLIYAAHYDADKDEGNPDKKRGRIYFSSLLGLPLSLLSILIPMRLSISSTNLLLPVS